MKYKFEKKQIYMMAAAACVVVIIALALLFRKSPSKTQEAAGDTITQETYGGMNETPVQERIEALSVDGQGIYMTEVSVRMYQLRDYYTSIYGETPWANTLEDGRTVSEAAKDDLYDSLIRTQILCNKAAEYDVGLSEAELQMCAEDTQKYLDDLGPQICQSFNVTFDGVMAVNQKQLLAAKVYDKVMNDNIDETDASEQAGEKKALEFETLYEQWLNDCTITEMPAWQNVVIGSVG